MASGIWVQVRSLHTIESAGDPILIVTTIGFSAVTLPAIGSKIAANKAILVDAAFYPATGTGVYNTYWQVW